MSDPRDNDLETSTGEPHDTDPTQDQREPYDADGVIEPERSDNDAEPMTQ